MLYYWLSIKYQDRCPMPYARHCLFIWELLMTTASWIMAPFFPYESRLTGRELEENLSLQWYPISHFLINYFNWDIILSTELKTKLVRFITICKIKNRHKTLTSPLHNLILIGICFSSILALSVFKKRKKNKNVLSYRFSFLVNLV